MVAVARKSEAPLSQIAKDFGVSESCLHRWLNLADIEYATAGWVDWYNERRLHGSLGNVPTVEYEQAHYAVLNPEPQPA